MEIFNPAKIDPILNIDLETKARGVDVTLTVSGPLNKLNLSYRSDPPLQWSDIVALLATGRAPTDPSLAIRDTGQSQNLQQLGASALIGPSVMPIFVRITPRSNGNSAWRASAGHSRRA